MSEPPPRSTAPSTAAWERLYNEAWRAQYRDMKRAAALGHELVQAARGDAAWQVRGWFHVAMVSARQGDAQAARMSLAAALAAAHGMHDAALDALCRDVQALLLRLEGRYGEALALLEINLALSDSERGLAASLFSHTVASQCCMSLGQVDRSLQLRYQALALAEALDDPATIANACGNLAGAQNDVLNLEDGHALATRAVQASELAGLQGVPLWFTAHFNLVVAQLLGHEAQEALATARRMQAWQERVPSAKRARYEVLWATAALKAGESEEAARWLDAARARWASEDEVIVEWFVTRAMLDNQRGDAGAARAVCERAQALSLSGGEEVLPVDLLQLYEEAARACETLGDLAAALDYKRLAFVQYEQLAGRSARARRVTAEIQHRLDLARRARDEALRSRQQAEAEQARLATLNDALREASATRTRFLAAASHDLRQPLQAMGLQLARLTAQVPQGPASETVRRLAGSVASLTGMFDSLLDISRIEAGGLEPQWEHVAIVPLLARLVEEHGPQADRRNLRLKLRVPALAHGLRVRSDAVLLDRLLRNLIGNALKYTVTGGVLVAVRRRAGGACWAVQIIDTGIGIEAQQLEKVFDAFYRVEGEARERVDGLGLGLSIVQRLAVMLGHPLQVHSWPGRGSRFGIQVQAQAEQPPAGAQTTPLPLAPREPADAAAAAGLCIALAEDNDDARHALAEWLRDEGCSVIEAPSADALLVRLDALGGPEAARPAGLITDQRMPGRLQGLDLARVWHQRYGSRAPVLLVSGDARLPAPGPGLQVLAKPVQQSQLRAWLGSLARPT